MQNLDNHMDDLFKKAAEDYPLKIQPGNFDSVLPFIGSSAPVIINHQTKKISRFRNWKLIVAMCLLILVVSIVILPKKEQQTVVSQSASPRNPTKEISPLNTQNGKHNNYNSTDIKTKLASTTKSASVLLSENMSANTLKKNSEHSRPNTDGNPSSFVGKLPGYIFKLSDAGSEETNALLEDLKKIEIIGKDRSLTNTRILVKESELNRSNKIFPDKSPDKPDQKRQEFAPFVYYGGIAGIEANSVKSQGMNRTTFNGGLALGLQITKHFAVESAVLLSQKKYYSDGKYFKPKTGSMPSNMVIRSLTSSNNVIELPISVKYDLSRKSNGFYTKLGLSSFILTKEENNYNAVVGGQEQQINSEYQTNHSYFASSVRLAVGYQKQYSKNLKLRIEPYLEIPIRGMGVGSMSVTSAGVQLIISNK